jgi:hypothetical protein
MMVLCFMVVNSIKKFGHQSIAPAVGNARDREARRVVSAPPIEVLVLYFGRRPHEVSSVPPLLSGTPYTLTSILGQKKREGAF